MSGGVGACAGGDDSVGAIADAAAGARVGSFVVAGVCVSACAGADAGTTLRAWRWCQHLSFGGRRRWCLFSCR